MDKWQPINTAPKDGSRVRVGHELDPQSMKLDTIFPTTGVYENGRWACDSAFVCIDGFLRWEPTHWLSQDEKQ